MLRVFVATALLSLSIGIASAWAATLVGTLGSDLLIAGSTDDTVVGLAGDDRLRGGAGDDVLTGGPGSDDMAGGSGTDAATFGDLDAGVTVTVDDMANDGPPGGHDNVQTDIEDVYGGDHTDQLTGSAGANLLDGGAGNDILFGGGGSDSLYGGAGDDRIYARDGVGESIECGDGFDIAIVDERDRAVDCDAVDRRPAIPRVEFTISYEWVSWSTHSVARRLRIRDLRPRRADVTISCSGRGCPARLRRPAAARGRNLLPMLRDRRLRPGAAVEVRATENGHIGRVARFEILRGESPNLTTRCIPLGSRRRGACPRSG